MRNLVDLITFIKNSPPTGNNWWSSSEWETHLSRSIPDWREIVRNPANWSEIETVRSKKDYDDLCENLVAAGGLTLAKRWFYSEVSDQKKATINWLRDNVSTWTEFDRDMKNILLTEFFRRWPGEPLEMMKEYNRSVLRLLNRDRPNLIRFPFPPHVGGYVPSSQVEKLRSIIADADDQVYLTRIDEMISRREEACKISSFQQQHRIPYTPNSNERELIARVMEITRRSGYLPAALPPIFISFETPPIFIAYPELEEEDDYPIQWNREPGRDENQIPRNRERGSPETISIEELLGVYQSRHQQIVIYERGIKWRSHRLDAEWLRSVVLIHEIGHWITHVLPKPGVPAWSTDLFDLSETDLHEGWAQLITWWVADEVGSPFKETFERLNQRQSRPYHVFEQFKDEPIDKVMESLKKLRFLSWPVRLQDWKQALR